MKRAVKIAWSYVATTLLVGIIFFLTITPARAPYGGKNSLGGRTIASQQEEEFDRKLMRYSLCYGIKFNAEKSTLERRRVCKAMLVHQMDAALQKTGAFLRSPTEFRCEDTAMGKKANSLDGTLIVQLRPNAEFAAIDLALTQNLELVSVAENDDYFARAACDFLTECKLAMRPNHFSLRKLADCFSTNNLTQRKILLDEVGSMIFNTKEDSTKILYSQLLREAQK